MKFGMHVSISGSIDMAVDRARKNNCGTFQIFTRNPRGWKLRDLVDEEVEKFVEKIKLFEIDPPVAHMPYLPNLSSPNDDVHIKSIDSLIADFERCGRLNIPYLVVHLGSHMGTGREDGLKRLVDACSKAFNKVENDVVLLLENTAGQKNSMGSSFEDLSDILKQLKHIDRIGVCFDTCHAFAAGYDLRNVESVENTLREFDQIIGLNEIKILHANDAKGELASGFDRHEHIGFGRIGEAGFRAILHNKNVRNLPVILETPFDDRGNDVSNIAKLRELAE